MSDGYFDHEGRYDNATNEETHVTSSGAEYGGGVHYTTSAIGNILLTNKHMTCYNCEESTKTISNTCFSDEPKKDCAKNGNSYARITYIGK